MNNKIYHKGLAAGAVLVLMPTGICYANSQSESAGFLEDSHLNLLSRNHYWHQTGDLGTQRDWTQGEMLDFNSGFTQGVVGFGIDAFAYGAIKLDGSGKRTGSVTLPVRDNGQPADSYSKAGGSIKVQLSNTLRYGDLQPKVPVFATGSSKLLNQTATGWMLDSGELKDIVLSAGLFTSGTSYLSTNRSGDLGLAFARVSTPQVGYIGGTYALSDQTSISFYGSRYENLMDQYYTNINQAIALSESQSLTLDFNLYRSLNSGEAKAGDINVTAASISAALATGPHTFALAFQRNDGDQPHDYAAIGSVSPGVAAGVFSDGLYLANAAELSDFNAPNEQSVQLRYELDMQSFGVPGLTLTAKHIRGTDIDGSKVNADSAYFGLYGKSEEERETDLIAQYIIPSGPAKALTTKLIQSWHSGDISTGGRITRTRLIISYPFEFF
ncbi:outer membrane porin, OprD family [Pseudomonas mediterranea]|uniref:OprD family outer membrane porin n=1 Tax=Pseudomonas mediterranea TaxID=183795 RepID=UPI00131906DC|nr:OprD family outer membrane porin [Pseudomonas mediterranea]QHA83898.1 outer membrane porin, OprD family [Pseudomonas mediterranea]